jgi:hypothetical protein
VKRLQEEFSLPWEVFYLLGSEFTASDYHKLMYESSVEDIYNMIEIKEGKTLLQEIAMEEQKKQMDSKQPNKR